ncbi:MAG: hypothetical protein H6R05_1117 [Burkholderiaceae bacterium]|nr:hypothetical protein [Burkholderiaceae bacterium]
MLKNIITLDWTSPPNVHAFTTTRTTQIKGQKGVSLAPFDDFNLATHVGDDASAVMHNRALLREILPAEPLWLNQTHGVAVYQSSTQTHCNGVPEADAVLVMEPNRVAVIMTADCLPVLFTTRQGNMVAGAHAGWRSLINGVLENTVHAMCEAGAQRADMLAWMGPAIGAAQFEVGAEVRAEFIQKGLALGISEDLTRACFKKKFKQNLEQNTAQNPDQKYTADIYALARQRLQWAGLLGSHIHGGGLCTVSDAQQFYSYRRDGVTGRMASLIWFE